MTFSPNIQDDSIKPISSPASIAPLEAEKEEAAAGKVDSGVSSIEKSKSVLMMAVLLMNFPQLIPPSEDGKAVAMIAKEGGASQAIYIMNRYMEETSKITEAVLTKWGENIKEIQEIVAETLRSPLYIMLQEVMRKGDPAQGNVAGVQGTLSASKSAAAKPDDAIAYTEMLERTQKLGKVPAAAAIPETSTPPDPSKSLIVPLAASMIIGGGLSVGISQGATDVSGISTNHLSGVVQLVNDMQTILPSVNVQDIIPMLNLMVTAPIYFHSWQEAVSNFKNNERQNYVSTVHKFAEDVIKMIGDPAFINTTIVSKMEGMDRLSPDDKDRLSRMLKLILVAVALSLLYSVEVGKVQKGQFAGILPEELRDLLLGELGPAPDPDRKPTHHEQLTMTLISQARAQLMGMSTEDKAFVAGLIVDYLDQTRELDHMLDPAKVFDETFASAAFNPELETGEVKA